MLFRSVASTYKRGTKLLSIPTTILSQADSCIGGKTAVNFYQEKNMIGTFYPADVVYVNTDTLKSLPDRDYANGFAEIIKVGLILDSSLISFLEEFTMELQNKDKEKIKKVIYWSNKIKSKIVLTDPYEEKGYRQVLNFGHTLGHALESGTEYELLHGEAISVGILFAILIGVAKKKLQLEEAESIFHLISNFQLLKKININIVKDVIFDDLLLFMMNDKKNNEQGICFVLLDKIGSSYLENISDRYFLEEVWEQLIQMLER